MGCSLAIKLDIKTGTGGSKYTFKGLTLTIARFPLDNGDMYSSNSDSDARESDCFTEFDGSTQIDDSES
jgi:hypothetical protein